MCITTVRESNPLVFLLAGSRAARGRLKYLYLPQSPASVVTSAFFTNVIHQANKFKSCQVSSRFCHSVQGSNYLLNSCIKISLLSFVKVHQSLDLFWIHSCTWKWLRFCCASMIGCSQCQYTVLSWYVIDQCYLCRTVWNSIPVIVIMPVYCCECMPLYHDCVCVLLSQRPALYSVDM